MNPRFTACEAEALTTTPSRRLFSMEKDNWETKRAELNDKYLIVVVFKEIKNRFAKSLLRFCFRDLHGWFNPEEESRVN